MGLLNWLCPPDDGFPEIGEIVLWKNWDYCDEKTECVVVDAAEPLQQVKLGLTPFSHDAPWRSYNPRRMFRTHRIHPKFEAHKPTVSQQLQAELAALVAVVGESNALHIMRQARENGNTSNEKECANEDCNDLSC